MLLASRDAARTDAHAPSVLALVCTSVPVTEGPGAVVSDAPLQMQQEITRQEMKIRHLVMIAKGSRLLIKMSCIVLTLLWAKTHKLDSYRK